MQHLFAEPIERKLEDIRKATEAVAVGNRARDILSDPLVDGFFKDRMTRIFEEWLVCPETDLAMLRNKATAVIALVQDLSKAIANGDTNAERLAKRREQEQAK